jgi:hypothetical protein
MELIINIICLSCCSQEKKNQYYEQNLAFAFI